MSEQSGARLALLGLLRRSSWFTCLSVVLFGLILVLSLVTSDPVLTLWSILLLAHAILGAWLSFIVHECGHIMSLAGIRNLRVSVEVNLLRVSVIPHGEMTGWEIVRGALAGPLSCMSIGVLLLLIVPDLQLHWWYLLHGAFLLPLFGDGRSLIKGVLLRRERATVP